MNITLWTANYHDGDKSDGITSFDLEPEVFLTHSEAVEYVFDYVAQRIIHVCTELFVEECLDGEEFDFPELKNHLDDASTDRQMNYINWYFDMANESESIAAYSIVQHEVESDEKESD